jgi:HSP20 family protein
MAAKSGNVTVKKNGGEEKRARAPASSLWPMAGLRGDVDRMFNRFLPEGWPHVGSLMDWDPFRAVSGFEVGNVLQSARADVSETDTEYEISVELPGIDEKDIEVDVSEGMLTLNAEKREEREEKKKNYHLTERSYGSVRRSFRVPEGVDVGKIKADFSKGVLQVMLPKTREAKAKQRKIPVKSS